MAVASLPSSDLDLLRDHLGGSPDAFADLVQRHVDMVYSAALRQVRDAHLADDVTQAVFLLLWQKASSLDSRTIVPAWLHRTTRYCAANALRLQRIRQNHEQRAATMALKRIDAGDQTSLEQAELAAVVDQAVAKLSEADRNAVIMRYFAGKSTNEIADTLNIAPDTARKRVDRAVGKLQAILRRMGVTTAAPALAAFLATRAVEASPPHVVSSVAATLAAAGSTTGTGAAGVIAKGALVAMNAKMKAMAAATALLLLFGTGVAYVASTRTASTAPARTAPPANAIRIQAQIDGRSRLIIRGNTVQWQHFEYEAPGSQGAVPTKINGKDWYPRWLGVAPGDAVNMSDVYERLDPPLPTAAVPIGVRPIRSRGKISTVQLPIPDNNFALIVEFDDAEEAGWTTYLAEIIVEAPPTAPAIALDLSTPLKMLESLSRALKSGDRAATYACLNVDPNRPPTAMDCLLAENLAHSRWLAAAQAKFAGNVELYQIITFDQMLDVLLADGRARGQEASIRGDSATVALTFSDELTRNLPRYLQILMGRWSGEVVRATRQGNQWKLDEIAMQPVDSNTGQPVANARTQIAGTMAFVAMLDELTKDVESGRITMIQQAKTVFATKRSHVIAAHEGLNLDVSPVPVARAK